MFGSNFLHNVNNPILKDHFKFHINTQINAKVTAVQSFENLHIFLLRQPCQERPPAHFPYNNRNSLISFAFYSVFVGPNDFKFGTETRVMVS